MDSPFNSGTSGSPASNRSSPSPPTVHYYRSDSVVVEKPPSHVSGESPENFEFYSVRNGDNSRVEVLVIDQSQPTCNSSPQSPCSGYNSNKTTDDEGDNEGELDEGFGDELGDEGFPQLLIPDCPPHSDMIPTATFLDDFDLGVDMFDSTEQTIPTSEALKSPYNAVPPAGPGSPYQFVDASSSPVSIHTPQDIQSQNNYNEYLNQVHSDASSTSSYSQHSGYIPTEEDELAMLLNDGMADGLDIMTSSHQPLALPISSCGQHTPSCSTVGIDFVAPNSLSYASSNFMTQANPSFSTPMLTSAQPSLMDLAEASQIAFSNNDFVNMSMGQLSTAPTITQTPPTSTVGLNNGYSTTSSVNMTIPLSSVTNSLVGAEMCSRSSQTTNNRLTRSLSPAPSVAHQHRHRSPSPTPSLDQYSVSSVGSTATTSGAYHYTPSSIATSPAGSSKSTFSSSRVSRNISPVPASSDELVDMPYYQFKKILDDPTIDTSEKEHVKNVRKRGKNKVAAKNCRQKKIEVVLGLQQEVDQMKERKRQLHLKCQGLEREINKLKLRCTNFRSLAYSQ